MRLTVAQALVRFLASQYTERDVPIFTCVAMPPGEMLDLLG